MRSCPGSGGGPADGDPGGRLGADQRPPAAPRRRRGRLRVQVREVRGDLLPGEHDAHVHPTRHQTAAAAAEERRRPAGT